MGTEKRERQKAARAAKREKELARAKRRRLMRTAKRAGIIIVIVVAIMIVLNLTNSDDASTTTTTSADASAVVSEPTGGEDPATSESTEAAPSTTATDAFAPVAPECPASDGSGPVHKQFTAAPPICIDADTSYTAVFDTTLGEITIALDQSSDMASVNNFIFLARHRYYEGVTFHRVIQDFMIQGGDPIGEPRGTGGPGYEFTGEQPAITEYPMGAFAMANTLNPSSNGSQFFIVTGPNGQALPNSYSLMGVVTQGQDIADAISKVETAPGDAPLTDVVINSIEIIES